MSHMWDSSVRESVPAHLQPSSDSDMRLRGPVQGEERTGVCTHTFRINGCEWDTGLHYTSEGKGLPTHSAGALLKFMSRGKQDWKRL